MELGPRTWAQVAAATPKCCATPEPAASETEPPGPALPALMHGTPRPAPMLTAASTAVEGTIRQKNAPFRPSIDERLPQHVLEAILGLLDRDTLCTARLVSKAFCAAASANICSLTCSSTDPGVSRQRFPRLSHVTVHHCGNEESLTQVATGLRDLITTLKTSYCEGFKIKTLAQIASMPKLRELKLHMDADNMDGIASLLRDCTNLEIITIAAYQCSLVVATTIASMTSLKQLSICRVCQPGMWAGYAQDRPLEESWLQQATALCKLQDLWICTTSEALPLIANLTGLTGLTWYCTNRRGSIDPLTRLTKLRSLCIRSDVAERNLEIACSLGAGSLTSLSLSNLLAAPHEVSDDCGRFLTRQTALARLTLEWSLCDLRHAGALRIELLESLTLVGLSFVDAEGLSALRKATRLTSLHISVHPDGDLEDDTDWEDEEVEEGSMGPTSHWLQTLRLSQGIGGLTQLRELSLTYCSGGFPQRVPFMDYALAVPPLTGLTQLEIHAAGLKDADLRAVLGLTGLRVLDVSRSRLTNAVVRELSVLTDLKEVRLISSRVTSMAPLTEILNPLRHARGWPPLEWTFDVEE